MPKPKPRPLTPRRMRFTDRDKEVLQNIWEYEGLMSRRQIAHLCFGDNPEWAKKRLRTLFENGYIGQPSDKDMHRVPRGEWIHWLDHLGLDLVAGLKGDEPLYTDRTRTEAPQWSKVEHDLALNDVRILVHEAVQAAPDLAIGEWINERTLKHWADEVTWTQPNGRSARKRFAMDGFFTILRQRAGKSATFAFLLEVDMGTHSNPAFADEKVRPGVTYITSPTYEARFGIKFGRYLVVTTGGVRLENMLRQTGRVPGGEVFYFTTFDDLTSQSFLFEQIWRAANRPEPFALIPA